MKCPHIVLEPFIVKGLHRLAASETKRFENAKSHYRSTVKSHLVGFCGEEAVSRYLDKLAVPHRLLSRNLQAVAEADIHLAWGLRIEVKTWAAKHWYSLGRCVAVSQLPRLMEKADIVVWCSATPHRHWVVDVAIEGFSTIDDIAAAPIREAGPSHSRVENHQVRIADLRSPWALPTRPSS